MVDWLQIGQTSGSGDTQILVRALPNTGDTSRDTTLVLSGLTKHIDIVAEQGNFVNTISISPDLAIFRYTGGTEQFSVESNYNWNVTSYPDWLELTPLSGGSGTTIITATSSYNTEFTAKTSDIVVSSLTVSDSAVVTLEGIPETINVAPNYIDASSGGTYQLTISSNVDWTIKEISTAITSTWLHFNTTAGTSGITVVTVTADTNTDYERYHYYRVSGVTTYKTVEFYQKSESDFFRMYFAGWSDTGYIIWKTTDSRVSKAISYRKNKGEWTTITSTTQGVYINVSSGDTLEFKGDNNAYGSSSGYSHFESSYGVCFDTYGNILSLIDSTGYKTITGISNYAFYGLFKGCSGVNTVRNTWGVIDTLGAYACREMYSECRNPRFNPDNAIPNVAVLGSYCYSKMFAGTNISNPPVLTAVTTLGQYSCEGMFSGCTSLVSVADFSNVTLGPGCFESMYDGCTSLTGVTSLTSTTLTGGCYRRMFRNCTSLVTAPSLPATAMTYGCYEFMFENCTSLTTAPELPSTSLNEFCYEGMFKGCTSLEVAPELHASTLARTCYEQMFYGCSSLRYIKCLATDRSAYGCTNLWVTGVANSGTFIKDSSATWSTGNSGIPSGWTVEDAT